VTPTFYLDEDVALALTGMLQELGHAATHTHAEAMDRSRDYQQLLHAATRTWVLVTHNARDFRLLHGAWRTWSHEWGVPHRHGGILIVEQLPPPGTPRSHKQSMLLPVAPRPHSTICFLSGRTGQVGNPFAHKRQDCV